MATLVEIEKKLFDEFVGKHDRGYDWQTDKESRHKYFSLFYEQAFAPYRDKEIDFLEIGAGDGLSLLIFKEYFKNCKSIQAVDPNEGFSIWQSRFNFFDYTKITYHQENAYRQEVAESLPSFDIIIEDAIHLLKTQRRVLELYCSKIKPNGFLAMEDIYPESNIQELVKVIPDHLSYEVVDLRKQAAEDSLLLVVRNNKG